METETYKVARDILNKFAPDQLQKTNVFGGDSTPSKQLVTPMKAINTSGGGQIRQRNVQLMSSTPFPPRMLQQTPSRASTSGQLVATLNSQGSNTPGPSALPLPRTILARDRSVMEKMVEYLIGDGPSNRYALICKQCNSHNGMALREEFEYIAFRCCYCYNMNPARKQRPSAPKLDFDTTVTPQSNLVTESSDSERNSPASESDSEDDVPPIMSKDAEANGEEAEISDKEHDEEMVILNKGDGEEAVNFDKGLGEGDVVADDSEPISASSSQTVTNSDIEETRTSVKTEQSL